MHTSFFDAHAIRLVQAPMAGSQNHALAAAVFKAGGLGSLPAAMLNAEQLHKELTAFQVAITTGAQSHSPWDPLLPLNVNFFCHTPPQEMATRITRASRGSTNTECMPGKSLPPPNQPSRLGFSHSAVFKAQFWPP